MKIIDKTKVIARATYQFINQIPTEAKIGIVTNFIGGAAVGNGIGSIIISNTRKGITKTIAGISLISIGTVMINNGINKMSNDIIADFYEKCADDLGAWIHVDHDQL